MKHAFGDGLLRRSLSLTVASAMVLGMCPTAGIAEGVLDAGRADDVVEIVEGYNDFCDGGSVPVGQGEASTGEEPSGDENAVAARGEGEEPAAEPEAELQLRVEPAAEPAAEPEAEAMAGPEAEEAADSYAITIDPADHGTVTASVGGGAVGTANVGDTVTLNDSPDEDYALKSLSVKYLDRQTETFEATSQTVYNQYCEIVADDPDCSQGWVFSPEKGLRFNCVSPYTFESVRSYSRDSVEGSGFIDLASLNLSRIRITNSVNNIAHIQEATVVCRAFFPVSVSENDGVKSFVMPNGPVTVTAEFAKKHSVTLAGGAHASVSGSTSQTGLVGAMETVTYTADEGYLFPEFEPITSDGVTATRTSETEVTVSGTPTADASITVPDARLIPATAPTIDGVSGASLVYGYVEGGVSVTATAPEGHTLRYQWFKNAANSNQGGEPLTAGGDSAAHSVETGKNAGTTEYYYCVVTATRNDNGQKASATSDVAVVTVEKADPAFTAPTGRTLIYNGSGQELVGAGSSDDGTLYYATAAGDDTPADDSYGTSVPTAKSAGEYTVWYKVVGDGNHNDAEAKHVRATIAPLKAELAWEGTRFTYDGKSHQPTATVSNLVQGDKCSVTVTGAKTNAGSYTATAAKLSNANYALPAAKTAKFAIAKAKLTTIAKVAAQPFTGKAITPKPAVKSGSKTLKLNADYKLSYKSNVNAGTATVTATGTGNYAGTAKTTFKIVAPSASYKALVQGTGWEKGWKADGAVMGTTGQSKRLEAVQLKLGKGFLVSGSIQYRTHLQGIGWEKGWKADGAVSGTEGQSRRAEAIQVRLTGDMAKKYDVYYRVHVQNIGWMAWAKNGATAGTTGLSKRMEAIQVVLVPKGAKAPATTYKGVKQTYAKAYVS